jgi:hypothetical protein
MTIENETTGSVEEAEEFGKEPAAEETPALSNREAMERAIAERRETREKAEASVQASEQPSKEKVKEAVAAEVEPPSEFSAAGKKAWKDGDVLGVQKEYRRIHDDRTRELTRAQRAEKEALESVRPWRDLGDKMAPYIKARGKEGVSPEQAMMEALALVDSFKSENPAQVKAELKKIGIDLDAPAKPGETQKDDPAIRTLQDSVNALLEEKRQREFGEVKQNFTHAVSNLAALKTRTGEPAFPGFQDSSESGIKFAKELGSLTQDQRFVSGVLRRFPEADFTVIVREAYKYLGGKVSGEPVSVSPQSQQKHIERSRRAAASTPGRVASRNDSSNLVGKLSNRAALAKALDESRGH